MRERERKRERRRRRKKRPHEINDCFDDSLLMAAMKELELPR